MFYLVGYCCVLLVGYYYVLLVCYCNVLLFGYFNVLLIGYCCSISCLLQNSIWLVIAMFYLVGYCFARITKCLNFLYCENNFT